MAVREFDGVDDVIRCGIGAANLTGAFTLAVLVHKTRDAHMETFLCSHTSGGSPILLLGANTGNVIYYEVNGVAGLGATPFTTGQGWYVVALTKAAGAARVRIHLRRLAGTAWTHENASRTSDANPPSTAGGTWRFANRGSTVFEASHIALAGAWSYAMSDAQVESLTASRASTDWRNHPGGAPRAMWELNQASAATAVTDATGGGAGQVAITGTAVVASDDPPGWAFLGAAPPPPPPTNVRRNVNSLTTAEWDRFVQALQGIKTSGVYDAFTRRHVQAMMQLTLYPGETGTQRNVAHRGPSFLPWHRRSLREFELELQRVDAGVMLPYWGWSTELSTWRNSAIWQRIGGDGTSTQGYRVTTGPFAGWTSVIWNDSTQSFQSRAGVVRQFSSAVLRDPAPGQNIGPYDVANWNDDFSNPAISLRRMIEVCHNEVHLAIGGDMLTGTAPNDPVFWLHHANCDRLWARWQQTRGISTYQPSSGGPTGHNVNDVMAALVSTSTTPASVLDWTTLGYTYDAFGS